MHQENGGWGVQLVKIFFLSFFSSPSLCVLCSHTTELGRRAVGLDVWRYGGGGGAGGGGMGVGGGNQA